MSFATVLAIVVGSEAATRAIWPQNEHNQCIEMSGDYRVTPNCTARTKIAESAWTTYHFNECGYRSETSCGPKPGGTLRIAVIGSSLALGYRVSAAETYYAQAAQQLSSLCHRRVDVQNLATLGAGLAKITRQAEASLSLNPDLVVFPVWPLDLEKPTEKVALNPHQTVDNQKSLWDRLKYAATLSRALLMLKHFLYLNESTFIGASLKDGDKADFMRIPLTQLWEQRYTELDQDVGEVVAKLKPTHVPLIVEAVPSRAEAALLSAPTVPPDIDAASFLGKAKGIAESHKAEFVDVSDAYKPMSSSENLYFAVDGHLNEAGQTVLAQHLVAQLLKTKVPALSSCSDAFDGNGGNITPVVRASL